MMSAGLLLLLAATFALGFALGVRMARRQA